jgi:hypothetical protein
MAATRMLKVKALEQLSGIHGHNREFLDMLGEVAEGGDDHSFAVGGNIEICRQLVGNLRGLPSVDRHLHQAIAAAIVLIKHPST